MSEGGGRNTLRSWLAHPRKRPVLFGAAGLLALLLALLLYLFLGRAKQTVQAPPPPKPAPKPIAPPPAPKPKPKPPPPKPTPHFEVTPFGAFAQDTFDTMHRKNVLVAAAGNPRALLTPPDLRFKGLDSVDFVKKVAAFEKREVAWFRDGWAAVLYRKAGREKLARFLEDIVSNDPNTRAQAAWRARALQDPLVVEPLLRAAQGGDYETARQARISLRAIGWESALLVNQELALPVVQAELARANESLQAAAAAALSMADAQAAMPMLLFLLASEPGGDEVPSAAAQAFVRLGTPDALAQLYLMAVHDEPAMRTACARALANLPGSRSLDLLKELVKDPHERVKAAAAYAIGCNPDPDKYPFFWDTLNAADPYSKTATEILLGLGRCDGEKPLAVLESVIGQRNVATSVAALFNLGRHGAQAWPLLDNELANARLRRGPDNSRPFVVPGDAPFHAAIQTLGHIADARARELLGDALYHQDKNVLQNALIALCLVGDADAAKRIDARFAAGNYVTFDRSAIGSLLKYPREQNFPLFEKAFKAQSPKCEWGLVDALADTGGDNAKPCIEQAMTGPDIKVRDQALAAMARMDCEWVQERLTAILQDASAKTPNAAENVPSALYLGLGSAGDERAILSIEEAKDDPERVMNATEISAMGRIGGHRALAHVLRFLKDAKRTNVTTGAIALALIVPDLETSDYPAAQAAAEAALSSTEAAAREHACRVLIQCGIESSVPALTALVQDYQLHITHETALLALAAIGTDSALEAIAKELSCYRTDKQKLAVRLLGNSHQKKARDLLIKQSMLSKFCLPAIREQLLRNWPDDPEAQKAARQIEARFKR